MAGILFVLAFQCFGQALTITSPTEETIWVGGTTQTITWTGGSSENVTIKLRWIDLGEMTIASDTPNDGSHEWVVKDGYTGRISILIFEDGGLAHQSFIRENSAGGIYITSPGYGVTWKPGSTQEITWTDNISGNVKIDLYERQYDEIPFPHHIARSITTSTSSDGSFSWTVPEDLDLEVYHVGIESVSASSTRVFSRYFFISDEPQGCIDEYEPNDAIDEPSKYAFSSSIGRAYSASESINGTIHMDPDWDHYRVKVEYPGNLDVVLSNCPDAFNLQLYEELPGGYVAGSWTTGNEHIDEDLTRLNYYYIIVGSEGGVTRCDPYNLTVNWTPDPFLEVSPSSRSVGESSGTTTFDISSNLNWSASEDASWFSVEKTSSKLLTVTFDENSGTGSRSANIVLSADGASDQTVSVTQEGFACSLSVTPASRNVGSSSGSTTFAVTSNVSWSVNESADWLSTSADGSTITVSYDANVSVDSRVAEITVSGGECSEVVSVTQNGNSCSLSVTPGSASAGAAVGTTSFTVTSNVPWSVNESSDWLSTSVDGSTVNVNYLENSSSSSRSASLTIAGGGCSETFTITQEGFACILSVTPASRSLGSAAGITSFIVTSNVSWSVNESADWLNTTVDGDIITVSFNSNEAASSRSASITVTGGECSQEVTLAQAGEAIVFQVGSSTLSLGATSGSSATLSITSNTDWSIVKSASWLNVSPLTGTGSSQVTVQATSDNNTGSIRTDVLSATGSGTTYAVVVTQDFITGVFDQLEHGVSIYPNPSGNELYVELGRELTGFTVRVMDSRGSCIFSEDYKNRTEFSIDLGQFNSGIYYMEILHRDGRISRNFIKR